MKWVQVGRCLKVRLWHQATCVLVHRHCELDIMHKWKTHRILQNLCCLVKITVKKYSMLSALIVANGTLRSNGVLTSHGDSWCFCSMRTRKCSVEIIFQSSQFPCWFG